MADQACTSMSVKEAALMHIPDLLSRLGTIRDTGLTDTDVELRRRRYGLNEMRIHDEEPLLIKYIGQVSGHVTRLIVSLWGDFGMYKCIPFIPSNGSASHD